MPAAMSNRAVIIFVYFTIRLALLAPNVQVHVHVHVRAYVMRRVATVVVVVVVVIFQSMTC